MNARSAAYVKKLHPLFSGSLTLGLSLLPNCRVTLSPRLMKQSRTARPAVSCGTKPIRNKAIECRFSSKVYRNPSAGYHFPITEKMTYRELKRKILGLLESVHFAAGLEKIGKLPARQAVNPLFSCFYHSNELIRWRAITAMGLVVSRLADQDIESARVIMRRLMWNLNDESGGIGWGSPEAMAEIMARHARLADEFSKILISYIDIKGNFIEHESLQRGVLWGLGRLGHARPWLVLHAAPLLLPFLSSEIATQRGLAAWATGALNTESAKPLLQSLVADNRKITIYIDFQIVHRTVAQLAIEALSKIEDRSCFQRNGSGGTHNRR